jgi:hypothetical protein
VLEVNYLSTVDEAGVELDVAIYGQGDTLLIRSSNLLASQDLHIKPGSGILRVRWEGIPVIRDRLLFATALWSKRRTELFDWRRGMTLDISSSQPKGGILWVESDFQNVQESAVVGTRSH